ncbi:cell division protein FtsQ/DivIB [Gordoniibacillus kamchatkensis]|uniref:cell division protein FtsQ/DivIB n=1 Tax=Gordoniibacillus kamchatkensis TaxID=1590651 RepID=UPI001E578F03|nr:FtsQ-type POTRA domain-containing protein [Paenibacillus sp. VKM B-2647]
MPDDRVMPVLREPKRRSRSNRKLLALLFLFFMTVLLILFFQSSLSKITAIDVRGNEFLSAEAIGQASGLRVGDHFFAHSGASIEKNVASLHMVQSVHVTKRFPGLVTIEVKEFPKVAFQLGEGGKLEAVLADGSSAPLQKEGAVPDKPLLTGWKEGDPLRLKLCKTLGQIPAALLSDISEIKPDPTTGFEDKIRMYTRSQFIVETTIGFLPDKIERLPSIVDNLHENNVNGGVITMLLTDSHAPLGTDDAASGNKDAADASAGKDSGAGAGGGAKSGGKDGGKDTGKESKPGGKPGPTKSDEKKQG